MYVKEVIKNEGRNFKVAAPTETALGSVQ